MKFSTFAIILFTLTQLSHAEIRVVVPKKDIPLELQIILDNIELHKNDTQSEVLKQQLTLIDQGFELMSNEDILFFVKSQVYKEIVGNGPEKYQDSMSIDAQLIQNFEEMIEFDNTHGPLHQWVASAIIADLERLQNSNDFRRALVNIQRGNELNAREQREYNKIKLVLPWMRLMHFGPQEKIHKALQDMAINSIERLSLSIYQYLNFGRFEGFTPDTTREELSFFDILDQQEKINKQEQDRIQKVVERILSDSESLPRPVDDWTPAEDPSQQSSRSAVIDPDPNYQAPDSLPKPVNDWIEDL